MHDDLLINSVLDIASPINEKEAIETGFLIYDAAMSQGSPEVAGNAFNKVFSFAQYSAIALSVATYLLEQNWDNFDLSADFWTWVTQATGKHTHTFERYWRVGQLLYEKPERQEVLAEKGLGEIIPIASAHDQGYEFSESDWENIELASNEAEVRAIIRDVKGVEPREGALTLSIDSQGTIWAKKNGLSHVVGELYVFKDDETVMQAIKRIRKNSGMLSR